MDFFGSHSLLRRGIEGVRTLFYPPHCSACACRLDELQSLDAEEVTLCLQCRSQILPPPGHRCNVCSHPMQGMLVCPNCDGTKWYLNAIVSGCRYEGLASELIQRFKYGRDQCLMRPLGDLLLSALGDTRFKGRKFDAIVPVPLHSLREREREFNQAALLASRLAKRTSIPMLSLLRRTRATVPQAGFDRIHRLGNLEGVFSIKGAVEEGAEILLVDDVTTTGTTLNACAKVLTDAGAGVVCAVTVAR